MARDGLVIDDFSGGLNNVVDPSLIAENEVSALVNFVISSTGKLISRPPMYKVTDLPSGITDIKMLGYYRNEEGVVYLVAASTTATYLYGLVSNTWTTIWNSPAADMTTYANRLYLVSLANSGGYWSKKSGTYQWTALNSGVNAMPNGNQIHYTKGRIYISSRATIGTSTNTSTIRYSNLTSTALGTSIDEFPVSNVIDINEGDGDEIVKIFEGNSELFIFRSNSTYRLAFSASADPSLGTLTLMSSSIGADCSRSVVEFNNGLAVLHAGTLYQFAGYNYYPLNPSNKLQFQIRENYVGTRQAVSRVGQYLLVWYHGYMYCLDSETGLWSEWDSDTRGAHFIEAPRGTFLESSAVPTAYGVPASAYISNGLLKLGIEYPDTPVESIKCLIITRTYDIGQPSKFKRLFGFEILTVAVNYIEAGLTPIDAFNNSARRLTWIEFSEYTWEGLNDSRIRWTPGGSQAVVSGLPAENPVPSVVKISGKQTFKRGFFTIRFENDGSSVTAPSRLDGIVMYLTNGRRMAIGRTA